MLDFSQSRLTPFQHQREDTERFIASPYFFIASEMRTGKTKIVIDGAQFLFEQDVIDRAIVVAPSPVRDVWSDKSLGELHKHLWDRTPAEIIEFHNKVRQWHWGSVAPRQLQWIVTNYEFIRSKNRLAQLLPFCNARTLLVLDESSYLKNWRSQQTKACLQLRRACGRVVLMNGTPINHSPLDLFSQGNILHPSILQCQYITHYKAKYAIEEPVRGARGKVLTTSNGHAIKTIVGWRNLADIQQRFAPCTVRRLQKDCLDLPPKLDPVTLTAELTPTTWRIYKEMRDDMVSWLQSGQVSTAMQAAVKVMRLAQITSGFAGGVEDELPDEDSPSGVRVEKIGSEKLDTLLWFLQQRLEQDENLHIVVWCRFRFELMRVLEAVSSPGVFPFTVGAIHGGQSKVDRLAALALLKPETSPKGPVFVGGTFGTGSYGLDFTAAHTSVSLSSDYSPAKFAQAADRVYGPGQKEPIAYYDVVATGPSGQRTIDHVIIEARRARHDLATWTAEAWVNALKND